MSKSDIKHINLVNLIRKTTQIESLLESLGGSGGGIWEKANSIENTLPQDFMQKIIEIAKVRNKAVHEDLFVENAENVLSECNEILEILKNKKKIFILEKEINFKLEEFCFFKEDNKIKLDSHLSSWIQKIKEFNKKPYNAKKVTLLLNEEKDMFKALNQYAKKYVLRKKTRELLILAGVSIVYVIVYILIGEFYDR